MAGIETAGLVLGVFPVLVELIGWSSGGSTHPSRDALTLVTSLRTVETIFNNSVASLLHDVAIEPLQVAELLRNPTGPLWHDELLNRHVTACLGDQARQILDQVNEIYRTVDKLRAKMPVSILSYCISRGRPATLIYISPAF